LHSAVKEALADDHQLAKKKVRVADNRDLPSVQP
jgi:hypothetical protein